MPDDDMLTVRLPANAVAQLTDIIANTPGPDLATVIVEHLAGKWATVPDAGDELDDEGHPDADQACIYDDNPGVLSYLFGGADDQQYVSVCLDHTGRARTELKDAGVPASGMVSIRELTRDDLAALVRSDPDTVVDAHRSGVLAHLYQSTDDAGGDAGEPADADAA